MSELFKGKKVADRQKLRGGYYTPMPLADFLTAWAVRGRGETILEPSCGDGNFLVSTIKRLHKVDAPKTTKIIAIELDEAELKKAKIKANGLNQRKYEIEYHPEDFFEVYPSLKEAQVDVVIGNPPFIRFQHFEEEQRNIAFSHLRAAGYAPTKLANAWSAFVQLAIELIIKSGKLAMVVPAELLQVNYSSELRERITCLFEHIVLVTFKRLVFPDIQQEVVLLLAEGKRIAPRKTSAVHTVEIENESELSLNILEGKILHSKAKHTRPGMKWTSFFLDSDNYSALDKAQKHPLLSRLGDIAQVDVGVVTGRNSFFVLDRAAVNEYRLQKYVLPLVGKTFSIHSLTFDKKEFEAHAGHHPAYLLNLKGVTKDEFSGDLLRYIALGEREGVHTGYKCKIRSRWHDVPSVYISDGFLFRQIHNFPLLVVNDAKSVCTDTIHRVRVSQGIDMRQLSVSFVNSLTFAWSEVCGRSYGGGVLELEPSEADALPVPYFSDCLLDFDFVNRCITDNNVEKALDYVDEELLVKRLNFRLSEICKLREAWRSLSNRRLLRK